MNSKEIQEIIGDDHGFVIIRRKGWFVRFDDEIPKELEGKISSDDYRKLVKDYNHSLKMGRLAIIFGLSIVLLPIAAYFLYKKIETRTLLWYKEQSHYRHNRCSFELLDCSRKRATLIFKYENNK